MKILNSKSEAGKCIFKEIQHIITRNSYNMGFSATVVLVCIFVKCYKELIS